MKYLLPLACLALVSCAAQKALPQLSEEQKRANERGIAYWQPDSTSQADTVPHTPKWAVAVPPVKVDSIVVEPHRTLLDKLLGRKPEPYTVKSTALNVGKKSTVNIYHGPATVTTTTLGKNATGAVGAGAVASVIEKKAGPAQVASDSSTQNALLGGGNLAAVQGDGNRLEQKAEQPPEKSLLATIWDEFKPALLIVAGVLGLGAVGFTLINTPAGPWLVTLFKRRKSSVDNGTV